MCILATIDVRADDSNERYQAERGKTPIAERPIMTYGDWIGDMEELIDGVYQVVRYRALSASRFSPSSLAHFRRAPAFPRASGRLRFRTSSRSS